MKGRLMLISMILLLFRFDALSQMKFRIKTINGMEFILPPHAKLAKEGLLNWKRVLTFDSNSRFRYQYFILKGMTSGGRHKDFTATANVVLDAVYYKSRKLPLKYLSKNFNISPGTGTVVGNFIRYYYSSDFSNIAFEIDTDKLFSASGNNGIISNFGILRSDLWKLFDALADAHWVQSVTTNIADEFYNLFPIPQALVLDRFMAKNDDKSSFCILSPRIWLGVDVSDSVKGHNPAHRDIAEKDFWIMNLENQILVNFYRDENGNIQQSPFLKWSQTALLPTDYLDADRRITLQASTIDMQLSNVHSKAAYVSFFQSATKTNNKDDADYKHANIFANPISDNSQLLSFNAINDNLFKCLNEQAPSESNPDVQASVFGLRDYINLFVPIFINNSPSVPVRFNSTMGVLKQIAVVPAIKKLHLYRIYKREFRLVKFYNDRTILLPQDKLAFNNKK